MAEIVSPLSQFPQIRTAHFPIPPQNPQFLFFPLIRRKSNPRTALLSCSCASESQIRSSRKPRIPKLVSEGRDEDENLRICPGCGIIMQDDDPNLPGFFRKPVNRPQEGKIDEDDDNGDGFDDVDGKFDDVSAEEMRREKILAGIEDEVDDDDENPTRQKLGIEDEEEDDDFDDEELDDVNDVDDFDDEELDDGFGPAGVGYGNITEEKKKKEKISKSEKKRRFREENSRLISAVGSITVCARCHSLRNYGQVKTVGSESLIPSFDLDLLIKSRLIKPTASATVMVLVVDCVDFDGSFPRSLFQGDNSKFPKLILVATKVDLLPSQISPARLDRWVRNRAKLLGSPKLNAVFLVSSRKDLGIRNLLGFIKEAAGPRGNVWFVGSQNAGKSTLINCLARKEGREMTRLTEAALPGTTLGILRIGGVLPAKAKLYDTPGLVHNDLMMGRLNREEMKMVEIRKELQPRTYRVKAGQTVHVGGLLRLDLAQSSVTTVYVSVWASPSISLHLGKTENAEEIFTNHVGIRLQPPIEPDGAAKLGQWKPREIKVSGVSWEVNSIDIAIAGLGWLSIGLKGQAKFILWTYDGVYLTQREPLVLDRAPFIERPGFLLPKAISEALAKQSKLEREARMEREESSV